MTVGVFDAPAPDPSTRAPARAGHRRAQHIVPQLVAEGPAPPGGEVELAIHMRPAAGLAWLLAEPRRCRPADEGRMAACRRALQRGRSRYPVPTRLTVAGLMNYVFEHDYAVLVRLRCRRTRPGRCLSAPRRTGSPAPRRSASRSRANSRSICRSAAGRRTAPSSMPGGGSLPSRSPRSAISNSPATSFASPFRCRRA